MQKKNLLIIVIVIIAAIVLLATNHKVNEKDKEIEHLKEQIEQTNHTETDIADTISTDTNTTYTSLKTVELSTGLYRVPDDIAEGTYNVSAKSGYGLLTGNFASGYISTTIGYDSSQDRTNTYSNLKLSNGDEFKIESNCTMVFTPK